MYNDFATTFTFISMYPDFDTFKTNVLTDIGYSVEPFGNVLYQYLSYEYGNSNFRYDTPEQINRHMMLVTADVFEKYKFRQSLIADMYGLTADDLRIVGENYSTLSENSNTEESDALDALLPFVSSQTGQKIRTGEFAAILTAIRDVTNKFIFEMLDEYRPHFMRIYPVYRYGYQGEQ